jgi:hypothetical protein
MSRVQPSAASVAQKLQVMFEGTRHFQKFVKEAFSPLVRGMVEPTSFELAILGTHFRIDAWLQSLAKLTGTEDVQAVSAGARAIFEMLVDLAELSVDHANADRYHAFTRVERYYDAKLRLAFADTCPEFDPVLASQARHHVQSAKIEIESLIDKFGWRNKNTGQPKWPSTWSSMGSLRDRCDALGCDLPRLYRQTYKQLSWFVHAGAVSIGGFDVEALELFCFLANSYVQDFTRMALEIVATECRLFDAQPSLRSEIDKTKAWTGRALMRLAQSFQPSPGVKPASGEPDIS